MYKIIALIGEAGTGKDTFLQSILNNNPYDLNEIINCTTRPIREGEIEGVNYFYLTNEEFADKILNDEMLESTCFNNWLYGTSLDALRNDIPNIGVFNPEGIRVISSNPEIELKVFRIVCDDKVRLLRQLNREKHPNVDEIIRRYTTDKEDFYDLDFDYIEIKNEFPEDIKKGVQEILLSCGIIPSGKIIQSI